MREREERGESGRKSSGTAVCSQCLPSVGQEEHYTLGTTDS